MDGICSEKIPLETRESFLHSTNEILVSSSYFEIFAIHWLELLEEGFGFAPCAISVTHFGLNKMISLDSSLEKKVEKLRGSRFSAKAVLDGLIFFPAIMGSPQSFLAFPESLKSHLLFETMQKWTDFYLSVALKADALTRKFRVANFSKDLLSSLQESSGKILDHLSCLKENLSNEFVFLWHVHKEEFYASEELLPAIRELERPLTDILLQSRYARNMYASESYRDQLYNLILYPVYAQDLIAFLGSFSKKPARISNLDISLIVEFCSNPGVVNCIEANL